MGKFIDITGQKYNMLTVLGPTEERRSGHIVWKCQCDCGNIVYVTKPNLLHSTKSCGCLKKKMLSDSNTVNLVGKVFGKLTVLERAGSSNGKSTWKCKCECGNTCIEKGIILSSGGVQSCGCMKSRGEAEIALFLKENFINFEQQKTFDNCRFPNTDYKAKFDFYLPDYNLLIEYDGEQHFSYRNSGWNTEEEYNKTVVRDEYKNRWAKENKINLLRIKYTQKKDIKSILEKYLNLEENKNE